MILARQGKRVVVCDRSPRLGGAWRVETALGYRNLEVGCHIFIPDRRVPIGLRALWELPLTRLLPPPRGVYYVRRRYLEGPYAATWLPAVMTAIGAAEQLAASWSGRPRGGWRQAVRLAWRSWQFARASVRTRWRAPGPLLYPPGGSGDMVQIMEDRVRTAGITLRLGCEVTSATVDRGVATLVLRDGATIRAEQIVLTRGSSIPVVNGLELPRREVLRRHVVMVLSDPAPRAFSYLQFYRHPVLERLSDVTSFARTEAGAPVEPGRKILCAYVTNRLYEQGPATAQREVFEVLKARGWIGPAARLESSGWWEDVEVGRDHRGLQLLQAANPAIRVISEVNLGVYLANNLPRIIAASRAVAPRAD